MNGIIMNRIIKLIIISFFALALNSIETTHAAKRPLEDEPGGQSCKRHASEASTSSDELNIANLPREVLVRIFSFAAPEGSNQPQNLRSVCQCFNALITVNTHEITCSTEITDDNLGQFVGHYPNLQALNLAGCSRITDVGLALLLRCTNLQTLYLAGCTNIRDAGLAHLSHCTNLQTLYIAGCINITNVGLAHLPPSITVLNLTGCTGLTEVEIEAFQRTHPHIKIIR